MVIRLALLILFYVPVMALAAEEPLNRCLSCHPAHHQQYGGCTDCHRGDIRSSRLNIAHFGLIAGRYAHFNLPNSPLVELGKQQLDLYACRRCHISGDKGNRLATNLDHIVTASSPASLIDAIRNPVQFMPDFHLTDTQFEVLINALYALAQKIEQSSEEVPQVVHFDDRVDMEENIFVKHCGGCHQILTSTLGGLGSGIVAPNLSGLLTEFYPKTADNGEAWNRENLKKWLKNPREIHPLTQMMPLSLDDEEFAKLLELIDNSLTDSPEQALSDE